MGNQGGQHHETSAFARRLGRGPVCHDRDWSQPAAATPCTNLKSLQLQHTTITSATDTTLSGLPTFCRVTATLTPTSDSTINIEVGLPEKSWNGRFLGIGGGGFQGPITNREYSELATGITNGFATAISDLGTGSSGCTSLFCGSAIPPSTGLYGHPERIKDFGYRAIHLMTVRGKEIVNAFYRQNAQKAYFGGCSTGG